MEFSQEELENVKPKNEDMNRKNEDLEQENYLLQKMVSVMNFVGKFILLVFNFSVKMKEGEKHCAFRCQIFMKFKSTGLSHKKT